MDHRGTANSPIPIDDSEDEVHGELCELTDDSIEVSRELDDQPRVDQLTMRISTRQPAPSHKRKRNENRSDFVQGSSSAPLPPAESKKSRKRRRKLERQTLDAEMLALAQEQQLWYNGMSSVLLDPTVPTPMPWNPMANMYYPLQDEMPIYLEPDPPSPASTAAAAATSDWVSAMALAGSLTDTNAFANQYQWPPPYLALPPSSPSLSPPALLERVTSPVVPHRPFQPPPSQANLPKKPPPTQLLPIGMKPDAEPHSKHGLFSFGPSNLSFYTPSNSNRKGYTPNPACTIVMEQLPKICRTIDFVKQWAKKAGGAMPLCIVVDPPSGKALVEFATAKMARMAWESPRLGSEYAGVKTHHLKGKPRTDLIRVWWYRVDGVGAGSGVGEIEEGEIEEDGLDKKRQPESKKAKKARLAKERMEKLARKNAAVHAQNVVVQPEVPVMNRDEVDSIASSREASVVRQMPNETVESMSPQVQVRASSSRILSVAIPGAPKSTNILTRPPSVSSAPLPIPILPLFTMDSRAPTETSVPIPGLALTPETLQSTSAPPSMSQASSTSLSEMKQMLLARQRNLEEKIARGKLEMSKLNSGAGVTTPASSSTAVVTAVSAMASTSPKESEDSNKAIEDRLRKLVLQSQKAKNGRSTDQSQPQASSTSLPASVPVSAVPSALPSPFLTTPTPSTTGASTPVSVPVQLHTSGISSFSLEDLAVSFITETISTLKHPDGSKLMTPGLSGLHQTRPSASRQNSASTSSSALASNSNPSVSTKEELAARQKRLEEYIGESKMLMTQLTQARTKQEKDRLLTLMREKSRLMDEEKEKMASAAKSTTGTTTPANSSNGQQQRPYPTEQKQDAIFKIRWPTESRTGGIMMISDDEEDEEGRYVSVD